MLGFLFSMESLALSLGCDRAQLELAVRQSHPEAPAKVALLWAAQLPARRCCRWPSCASAATSCWPTRWSCPAFPQYLSGFVQALEPVPALAPFVVEVMSKAFARLPDPVLLPWLPTLITTLREQAGELVPVLIREAGRTFPGDLAGIDSFVPPWSRPPRQAAGSTSAGDSGWSGRRTVARAPGGLRRLCGAARSRGGVARAPGRTVRGGDRIARLPMQTASGLAGNRCP